MIGDSERQRLVEHARAQAEEHPVELERALQQGMSAFRRRVALTYAATCAVVVAAAILFGASVVAIGQDSAHDHDGVTVTSVVVKPRDRVLAPGETARFVAVATFSDDSTRRVTRAAAWRSSDNDVITINRRGRAVAVSTGIATIRARWGSVAGSAKVTVTKSAAVLRSIDVSPSSKELRPGATYSFRAVGTYDDGTSSDITQKATWRTSDPATVSIDAGRVTAVSAGEATITATLGGRSDVATVVVSDAGTEVTLLSVTVKPSGTELAQGQQLDFVLIAHYSDDRSETITRDVGWASGNLKVVQIDQSGRATAVAPGSTTITATFGTRSASADVTVPAPRRVLTAVEVSPSSNEWCSNTASQQLDATAVYDDGTREALERDQVQWSSSNNAVATVNGTGFVSSPPRKPIEPATVFAEFDGTTGEAGFSCTPVP